MEYSWVIDGILVNTVHVDTMLIPMARKHGSLGHSGILQLPLTWLAKIHHESTVDICRSLSNGKPADSH